MDDIEGLRQRAVTSDLDFHHPKGASLDTVNPARILIVFPKLFTCHPTLSSFLYRSFFISTSSGCVLSFVTLYCFYFLWFCIRGLTRLIGCGRQRI